MNKKNSPQKMRRSVHTWKEKRVVKIAEKPRITGNPKNQQTYKFRNWKKRKERKHIK